MIERAICKYGYTFIAATAGTPPTPDQIESHANDQSGKLINTEWSVTGPETPQRDNNGVCLSPSSRPRPVYNCIAFSLGRTNNVWVNQIPFNCSSPCPGITCETMSTDNTWEPNKDVDDYYVNRNGCTKVTDADINAAARKANVIYYDNFHAARKIHDSNMEDWIMYESKQGPDVRIEHVYDQITIEYGQPKYFYICP